MMRNCAGFHTMQRMNKDFVPLYRYWQPRFWPGWLVVGMLRLIVLLPQTARMACGRGIGRLMHRLLGKRRHIAQRNLELCFPELDGQELAALARRHFESLGMGVVELGMAWWCSDAEIQRLTTLKGIEYMHDALKQGKGALMLSGHFAATEISGRVLAPELPPMAAMYRASDNPMNDQIMRRCRGRSTEQLVTKTGIRTLIKLLRKNYPFWYAADQAYEGKGAMLVPFFNEPAMTNAAISQIAKVSKSPILPFFSVRQNNGQHYEVEYLPPLEDFPSDDPEADALRINHLLEEQIRKAPEQYYWVHRRFKGRREGYEDPYKKT